MKKKLFSAALSAAMAVSFLSGCGGGLVNNVDDGTVNTNLEQTQFNIMGGISALSSGYENNEVLTALQEQAGIAGLGADELEIFRKCHGVVLLVFWCPQLTGAEDATPAI